MPVLSLRIFLLACLGLLTACSPLTPVNLLVPNDSYRLLADQPYGDDPRQQLDVYLPQGELDRAPVVLFFYGGSWRGGNKDNYTLVGEALAARGIIAVVADSQPLWHAGANSPPAFLMAARPDRLVDPERNTAAMADKLSAAGVAVDSHLVDERNHFTLVLALAYPFQGAELDTLVAFIFRQASTPVE